MLDISAFVSRLCTTPKCLRTFKMADVQLSKRAYCKMLLHAAKYPHCAINGVLLAEKPKQKESRTVIYVDCIPLFHISLTLAPMLEVALTQIDSYCKNKGLVIAGYYQANEYYRDASPGTSAYRIADRISENNNGESYILMIDNRKMSSECEEQVCRLYKIQDQGKWKHTEFKDNIDDGILAAASALLKSKGYNELVDFDGHFDDITLDWRNLVIDEQLKHLS